MLSLRLFGGLSLSDPGTTIPARANQRRRLALLAILAATPGKLVSRDKIAALLWPDAGDEHARHLLSDSLYVIRSALGDNVLVLDADTVAINCEAVQIDVAQFLEAIRQRDYRKAVEIRNGGGPFLDGVHLADSPEFEHWLDSVRAELTPIYHDALRRLAEAGAAAGDHAGAVMWWRRLSGEDPLSSSVALGLMRALHAAGDRAGALAFARVYERLVRSELDSAPDAAIISFVERLRAADGEAPRLVETAADAHTVQPAAEEKENGSETTRRPGQRRRSVRASHVIGAAFVVLVIGLVSFFQARRPAPTLVTTAVAPSRDYSARHRTRNSTAYVFYLRGRQHREQRSMDGFRAAIADYRAAIDLDSSYAEAYAGLSEAYLLLRVGAEFDKDSLHSAAVSAEGAALKALSLADSLAEAHMALGIARMNGPMNFAEAERELTRAHALDPNDARTREYLIVLHCWTGRAEMALSEARAEVAADQLSMGALRELGRALVASHRYDEALTELERIETVGVNPVKMAPVMAAEAFDSKEMYSSALRELAGVPGDYVKALRGYTLSRMGKRAAAESVLADLMKRWADGRGGAFEVSVVYVGLRDFNRAFEWLNKSFDDLSARGEIMDPLFEDLRADPRFAAVRRRLGLPLRPDVPGPVMTTASLSETTAKR